MIPLQSLVSVQWTQPHWGIAGWCCQIRWASDCAGPCQLAVVVHKVIHLASRFWWFLSRAQRSDLLLFQAPASWIGWHQKLSLGGPLQRISKKIKCEAATDLNGKTYISKDVLRVPWRDGCIHVPSAPLITFAIHPSSCLAPTTSKRFYPSLP